MKHGHACGQMINENQTYIHLLLLILRRLIVKS